MDWNQVRENFPAVKNQKYFFTAAVGPLHRKVYEAYIDHTKMMYEKGDVHYEDSIEKMEGTRQKLATLLDASAEDMGFLPNTSHGMNLLALMLKQSGKTGIVAPADEFPSSTIPWFHHGFEVNLVPSKNGVVEVHDLLNGINEHTAAVVTSAVQYSTGYRIPLKRLGDELAKRGIPLIVNATQCLGLFPLSVKELKVSALLASTHKWFGAGYGCSVCFMDSDFRKKFNWPVAGWLSMEEFELMSSQISTLKSTTSAIETGVPPFATLAGLDAACDVALDLGVENIAQRVMELSAYAVKKLNENSVKILSPRDDEGDYIKSINSGTLLLAAKDPEKARLALEEKQIYATVRGPGLRIAIHYFNNFEDIDFLIAHLKGDNFQ